MHQDTGVPYQPASPGKVVRESRCGFESNQAGLNPPIW